MPLLQPYLPHPALRPYVRYYWSLDIRSDEKSLFNLQVIADRYPRAVIQCLDGKNALYSKNHDCINAASLKGISSKPALFQMESTYSHVAVSFFPHGVKALFGIDGCETVDSVIDLHHFFPTDVIEKIIACRHSKTRITILENCLLKKLSALKTIDRRIIDFVNVGPGIHYGHLLKSYGISERQFERKFSQSVGFTPSFYKRVVRFEKAFQKLQCGDFQSLSNLAYDLGYSDQSHMNREFRQLSGSTPLTLIAKDRLLQESGSLLGD